MRANLCVNGCWIQVGCWERVGCQCLAGIVIATGVMKLGSYIGTVPSLFPAVNCRRRERVENGQQEIGDGAGAKVAQAAGIWHTKPTPPPSGTPARRRELTSLLVLRAEPAGESSGPGLTVFGDATLRCNAMQKVQGADRAESMVSLQFTPSNGGSRLPTPCPHPPTCRCQ